MEYVYEQGIDVNDYNRLRDLVGWGRLDPEQAQAGLDNSAYVIRCSVDDNVIASARVLWDCGYTAYICDVMVDPEYQRIGVGSKMIANIMDFLNSMLRPGWKIMAVIVATKGREDFYSRFGFEKRPNEISGAGMSLWLE